MSVSPSELSQASPDSTPISKTIFIGPNGLRVGWRLLIFLALIAVLLGALLVTARLLRLGPQGNPQQITITPLLLGANDAILFLIVCIATLVMGRIERRRFAEYGLPLRCALREEFWVGSLIGFLTISGTLLTMFLLHAFRITGLALHGTTILASLAAWTIAFFLVGLFEEFTTRGYVQFTLALGIGFWPAAFVMSCLFGLGHARNPGENIVGLIAVVMFGLLLCLFLRRTGNLWCAVGFHMAYDWGQMFYGVPDSGIVPYHNLLNSVRSGPRWLSGGTVGPEASILTPIALLLAALIFSRFYPKNRYQVLGSQSSATS